MKNAERVTETRILSTHNPMEKLVVSWTWLFFIFCRMYLIFFKMYSSVELPYVYLIIFQNVRWNLDKIKRSIVQLASKANFSAAFCQYILFYSHIYNEREIYKITKYYIICIITAVSEWESYWQNEHWCQKTVLQPKIHAQTFYRINQILLLFPRVRVMKW